jgi:hypothetical protein
VTVDRSRAPAIAPSGTSSVAAQTAFADQYPVDDEPWFARSASDSIILSPSASRRLAEPGRSRAFVLDPIEDADRSVDLGAGRSIDVRDGLYSIVRTR